MYPAEYIEFLKQEAESMRPRIEELRQIIFCPDSNATLSELKEFCALNDRIKEMSDILAEQNAFLAEKEESLLKEIAKKDAEIRVQAELIDAMEKRLEK